MPEFKEPTMPKRKSGTERDIVHSWLFTKESGNKIMKKYKKELKINIKINMKYFI